MSLEYAVDRLVATGWQGQWSPEYEALPDGRRYPGVQAVRQVFASEGLELTISYNERYNCHRATWRPVRPADGDGGDDDRHGTVVGASAGEAAVYALAQWRESRQLVVV